MQKKSLNHNRQFMFGIMAMGMIVIIVTIIFWMWCFPDGTKPRVDRTFSIELLPKGFPEGNGLRIYLNDSVIFQTQRLSPNDTVKLNVPATAEQNIVALENTETGESQLMNVSIERGRLILQKQGDEIVMQEIPAEK